MIKEEQEQIQQVFQGLRVAGSIFISNLAAAKNQNTLKTHNIVAAVSASRGFFLFHAKEVLPNYLYIPVDDTQDEKIKKYFGMTFDFIEKNRKRGNVLIHCYLGRSRSATIIAAYLIRKYGYTMPQAIYHLRRKHKKVNPNRGFLRQLDEYSKDLIKIHQKVQSSNEIKLIKDNLIKGLSDLKQKNERIDEQIKKANECMTARSKEKRSKSEYLKKRLQKCVTEQCSRQNSFYCSSAQTSEFDMKALVKKLHGVL